MQTIVIISDLHANHKFGLNKPEVKLDESDKWQACEIQKTLFRTWEDCLEKIENKRRGKLTGIINGDLADIDAKQRTQQIISRNNAVVIQAARELLEPFANMCDVMYATKGTEAHVGDSAWIEDQIMQDYDNAVTCPETSRKAWWFLPLEVEGVKMDIAHHPKGGGGGRPQNSQSMIDRLASDTLFEYANQKVILPDLVIRSHIHQYKDSRDAFAVRAITTPAFCFLGAYARRLGINSEPGVGCVLIYVDGGKYHVEPILYKPRRPQWVQQ